MNRALLGTLLASTLVMAFSACDAGLSGSVGPAPTNCSPYLSCDTCTPVYGCGWCAAPNGSGVCASDPDYCPTLEFSWTWDPKGCRVAADASVGPTDDASVTVEDVAAPREAATVDANRPDGSPESSTLP
jgi:hypothetical protein